uniref:Reverse transcriptase n=1 Tax=Romanomermis culicivorax TaxID=13658 RepID=A0A915L869_ROMCU
MERFGIQVESDQPNHSIRVNGLVFTDPTLAAGSIVRLLQQVEQEWFAEQFPQKLTAYQTFSNDQLDQSRSYKWLPMGMLGSEAAINIIAAQEGQLLVNAHPANRKKGVDPSCRLRCRCSMEKAEHILTICPHWRTTLMVKRHNSVARNIYYLLCVKYGFDTRHFNQMIEGCRQNGPITLYWDHPIITTKKVLHHRPDLVMVDEQSKTVLIIEVSVAWHTWLCDQEMRKHSKYAVNSTLTVEQEPATGEPFPVSENLATEMGRDLGCKVTMVPIVIGATGEISKNLRSNLNKLGLTARECEKLIERMARSAVIGSAVIIKAHCSIKQ